MSRKRKSPSLRTKLAAALLFQPVRDRRGRPVLDADGCLTYALTYAEARLLTADQMLSLFEYDHDTLHALDGSDEFWNFTPRLRMEHRQKSRRDTAIAAKTKRVAAAHAAHVETMAKPRREKPARQQAKNRTPRQHMAGSRASRYKRHFDGSTSLRW